MGSKQRLRARRRVSLFETIGWAVVYSLGGMAAWSAIGGVISVLLSAALGGNFGFEFLICPMTLLVPVVAIVSLVVVGSRNHDRDFAIVMCEPLCPTCGYSTEGRRSLQCPECGLDDPREALPGYVLMHLRADAVRDAQRAAWGLVDAEVRSRAAGEWWRRGDGDSHGAARMNVVFAGSIGGMAVGFAVLLAVGMAKGAILDHVLIVAMAAVLGYLGVAAVARRMIGLHAVRAAMLAGKCAVCGMDRPGLNTRLPATGPRELSACPGCGTPDFVADQTVEEALAKRYHRHASLFALPQPDSVPSLSFPDLHPDL